MPDLVSKYRELLAADESLPALDGALELALRIASGGGNNKENPWHNLLRERTPTSKGRDRRPADVQRLEEVAWVLSAIPRQVSMSLREVPEDQYSILMDTLLLVFHQAYFALLPNLAGKREALMQAFREFSSTLPRRSDQLQVVGLVELEEQNFDAAVDAFRTALAATHSDEHDFITRVQMVWTVLMERRLYSQAFDCLMEVYPRTSRSDLSEVSALLRETFLEGRRKRITKPAGHRTRKRA